MANRGGPIQVNRLCSKLVISSLEKIIKNASWRRHSKLLQDCKAVVDWYGKGEYKLTEYQKTPPRTPGVSVPRSNSSDPSKSSTPGEESQNKFSGAAPDAVKQVDGDKDSAGAERSTSEQQNPSSSAAQEGGDASSSAESAPAAKTDSNSGDGGSSSGDGGTASNQPADEHSQSRKASTETGSDSPSAGSSAKPPQVVIPRALRPWEMEKPPPRMVLFEEGNKSYSYDDTDFILKPLLAACETLYPKVVECALDCFQKMIVYGHLRGEMDVTTSHESRILAQIMDSVCLCFDLGDEEIELLVLKLLLSAVTSTGLRVHGECLLKAVRTCYNVFLGSKSAVNQTTAKASLTQMLIIVFRRMEADSSTVPVTPIVVADLMEPAERSMTDSSVTQAVQNFITRVTQDIEVVLNPMPSPLRTYHGGAFESPASMRESVDSVEHHVIERDMMDAQYWEMKMLKGAMKTDAMGMKTDAIGMKTDSVGTIASIEAAEPKEENDPVELHITNKLRRDAFLVFRALCKLSMKAPPQEGTTDPYAIRGKMVALELLKILLENAGAVFRTSERFIEAIKQYLCLSLLKNSASSMMPVYQFSCSIFMSLVSRFRAGLKSEIGVFFPMIVLRVLENVAHPNYQQKMIVLRFLEKLCIDSQILVDIFVNYDCDIESSNIFERMVNGLLKTAQGVPSGADTSLTPQQIETLKLAAIKCMVGVLRSMGHWANRHFRLSDAREVKVGPRLAGQSMESLPEVAEERQQQAVAEGGGGAGEGGGRGIGGEERLSGEGEAAASANAGTSEQQAAAATAPEPSAAEAMEQRRAYKLEFQEGINLFNRKPKKGIDFLVKTKKIGDSPEEVASFLRETSGLDKTMIGDFLGEREDFNLRVMHTYVDAFKFQGLEFDEAIRLLLQGFRLPGEAQKIDRIMEKFAERYCRCNPKAFSSADTAYVLAYSVIMLNTDAHNPMVKNKMTKQEFIRNNRGIDDGNDLPEAFMEEIYERISRNEIKMKDLSSAAARQQQQLLQQQRGAATSTGALLGLDSILNLVRKRDETPIGDSDEIIRHMQEQFKAKAGKSGVVFYAATDVEMIRPMVEVVWAPMLAAFSVPLDSSEDEIVTFQCLEGFRHAIHITALMTMRTIRDAFLTSLAKFTSLHSAADIKQKNIDAIKALIAIADEDGNHLQDAWEHILTCVSRFEHLHLIGEGAPTDATFFAAPQNDLEKKSQVKKLPGPLRVRGQGRYGPLYAAAASVARRGSYDSAGVSGNTGVTTEQVNSLVLNLNMLEQIDSFEVNRIFTRSERLNSEAIVDFVRALCKVSMEELRSATDPRVFSLTKIVEISHFNMNRIRLVWNRIWSVLAEYFVTVGCMENLSVAMYAIDSLRQLAMKFLERDELSNYNFQQEFLKPFVIVMRKSGSVEIRELIIRCVSQMVFARVASVKSGWKIMFMVFTTAATDDQKNIVLLAFETIEKVVREYFPYITETETTTFTDCVNCLIAFTNSRFNKDVSLNAIAFLRFCALKLAEGELGSSAQKHRDGAYKASPGVSPSATAGLARSITFTDRDDHLYFWFPLLAGLSELTFDPRPDIRKSALEVLFDTLRFHGHMFSSALWEKVFDSVLFPIFDYVRRASEPRPRKKRIDDDESEDRSEQQEELELEMDAWLYETCTLALQLVVDLFVKFYSVVSPLLPRILALLTGFIKRPHQSLAAIGVAAFVRLMSNAGELFSDEKWDQVLLALKDASYTTLPNLAKMVEDGEGGSDDEEDGEEQEEAESMPSRDAAAFESASEGGASAGDEDGSPSLQHTVSDVRCRIAVQLLLVQAMNEIYSNHATSMSLANALLLFDTLHMVASHAHNVNSDRALRFRLQNLRMLTQMPDPPLLRLESEAYQAYLTMLQRLPKDKPELADDTSLEQRLVELCAEVLGMYITTAFAGSVPLGSLTERRPSGGEHPRMAHWTIPLGTARRRELTSRAPLLMTTIKAIGSLREDAFLKHLGRFLPLLAQLVGCEHGTSEVQTTLSTLFSEQIGPALVYQGGKHAPQQGVVRVAG